MNRRRAILASLSVILAAGYALPGRADQAPEDGEFHFHLKGGFFFGPGPVKPDTSLPDGDINGIVFDTVAWRGEAKFRAAEAPLSDGATRVNANINAGRLGIGDGKQAKTFWLTAVDGGPNHGTETYTLDKAMNFVWQVDLALDPGFVEGIIRVNGFRLTTGWVRVPSSMQSAHGEPGGFDRAGSLPSGTYLVGRLGDFTRSGFLNGTLVATANVPMQADMLPGAPVANQRGFTTDVPVDPAMAAELTLAGIDNMQPVIDALVSQPDLPKLIVMLSDIADRIDAASLNCEDAFLRGDRQRKDQLQEIRWRIDEARKLFFISWAILTGYSQPTGKPSASVTDSMRRGFATVADTLPLLRAMRVPAQGGTEAVKPGASK